MTHTKKIESSSSYYNMNNELFFTYTTELNIMFHHYVHYSYTIKVINFQITCNKTGHVSILAFQRDTRTHTHIYTTC